MAAVFDEISKNQAFRLELVKQANGAEGILWHGKVDGEEQTFTVDLSLLKTRPC